MIGQLNIFGKDKVQVAIERFKAFEPLEGYFLAFSGGKDSVVIKALADMAGVKYDTHYQLTSVDPPEMVQFVKSFDDVIIDVPRDKGGERITMWNLIPRKMMPPTRLVRYCCQELKESGGDGRFTVTGVRWAESSNRKNNQGEVTIFKADKELAENENFTLTGRGGVILTNDNEDSRKMIDTCYKRRKTVLNPIIDWSDDEVWEFIRTYNVRYCELYDKGYKRLGCVGCPMSSKQDEELNRYPKIKRAYLKAFERMLKARRERGLKTQWENAEQVYDWWIGKETT